MQLVLEGTLKESCLARHLYTISILVDGLKVVGCLTAGDHYPQISRSWRWGLFVCCWPLVDWDWAIGVDMVNVVCLG